MRVLRELLVEEQIETAAAGIESLTGHPALAGLDRAALAGAARVLRGVAARTRRARNELAAGARGRERQVPRAEREEVGRG